MSKISWEKDRQRAALRRRDPESALNGHTIQLKWPCACRTCGQPIEAGAVVNWNKALGGAEHIPDCV